MLQDAIEKQDIEKREASSDDEYVLDCQADIDSLLPKNDDVRQIQSRIDDILGINRYLQLQRSWLLHSIVHLNFHFISSDRVYPCRRDFHHKRLKIPPWEFSLKLHMNWKHQLQLQKETTFQTLIFFHMI
jgi:hypothetical protein